MAEKDNVGLDNVNLLYRQPSNTSDWQLGGSMMTDSMRLISAGNSMSVCQANILESSSCSSASIVDSLCPMMWEQPTGSQNLGFCDINVHRNESSPNTWGNRPSGQGPARDVFDSINGLSWGSPNEILEGGMLLPGAAGFLPSLPHLPADSGFIERAARYSCFSGGNFGEILDTFGVAGTLNPVPRGLAPIQRSEDASSRCGLKPMFGAIIQKNEVNMAESSKHVCLSTVAGVSEGSPLKNEKNSDGLGRSDTEAKLGINDPDNNSEEAGFSGQAGHAELDSVIGDSSKGVGLKKRKRSAQDNAVDQGMGFPEDRAEAAKDQTTLERKGKQNPSSTYNKSGGKNGKQGPQASDIPREEYIHEQNPSSTYNKSGGKNGKQGPQASDIPIEEYIHVRARRGQATNSHSLAERVRREKISERMKLLQDLVPGCSKVTGKAVMLDEIINYVQSLQRQVEFLSMKLATVNPQLDFSLERLLSKDILQSGAGPSSLLGFPPDMQMGYPPLHQSQGIAQTGVQGLGNVTHAVQRSMRSSLTAIGERYKEPSSHQVRASWEDDLHNAFQMGLISTVPRSGHDISGSLPTEHTRAEL